MRAGKIIYFDGPDGAGKTTQLELTARALKQRSLDVYVTRTLGGTPIGESLRKIILSKQLRPVETDLYISLACYYALLPDILARREAGEIVLIDRSPLSIIGYQAYGDGFDKNRAYDFVDEVLQRIGPNLILVYSGQPTELAQRRRQRNQPANDYFEAKPASYHQRVAEGFAAASQRFQARTISAMQPVEAVQAETVRFIEAIL